MCGIIGYVGKEENTIARIIEGLEALEYRGYDSVGIAYFKDGKIQIQKRQGRISQLKDELQVDVKTKIGIGHTRWATHGEPNEMNAHPHQCGKFAIVHNGIIENYQELKKVLQEEGYTFYSQTDSEVIAVLLDYLYQEEKDVLKTITKASKLLKGSFALGILCEDDEDTLYAIRVSSPLIVAEKMTEYFIASDVPAILSHTREYYALDDFDIATIQESGIHFYHNGKEIKKEKIIFSGTLSSALKNGFDHFMLKEIYEQPKVIQDTTSYYFDGTKESLWKNLPDFQKYDTIHIVACGSAYHAGLIGKFLIEEYASLPVFVEVASEYRYQKQFYTPNTLVIVISQSGETADTLASLRKANQAGIDTLAIVNVVGSSIAREAKQVLYTKAGCEIAVATTKAYSAQIALLSLIALQLGLSRHSILEEEFAQIKKELSLIPTQIDTLIHQECYSNLAKEIYHHQDVFFLGRKLDYAMSLEGSLKLKEISYINSVSYPAGELKHGTISLIEENTPVIGIITDEEIRKKTESNLEEVKSRGAKVILISNDSEKQEPLFIYVPKVHPLWQPLLTIIPLQLLAYQVAILRGCDIDKPRNLAKSVTVE